MILSATTISERGKEQIKTANEYINIDLTVHRQKIGSIELYLNKDTEQGLDTDEWLVKWYSVNNDIDPDIIAQGNTAPEQIKRRTR